MSNPAREKRAGRINGVVLREVQHQLDLTDTKLSLR